MYNKALTLFFSINKYSTRKTDSFKVYVTIKKQLFFDICNYFSFFAICTLLVSEQVMCKENIFYLTKEKLNIKMLKRNSRSFIAVVRNDSENIGLIRCQ